MYNKSNESEETKMKKNEKLEMVKRNVQMHIDMRTEEIERLQKDIRDCANRDRAYDMITFLPGKLRDLENAMEQLRIYREQMQALEFLEGEE